MSKNLTSTIITFRLSYAGKRQLIDIADKASDLLRKNEGEKAPAVTVSDVIKNALQQTYGVECG